MTTGWTTPLNAKAYTAAYGIGASIYTASWGVGSSIYTPLYFIYVNGQIVYRQPVNTVAPVITGTPNVGFTLTTSDGTWVGFGSITFTYQWWKYSGGIGTTINGATSNAYTLTASELGYQIYCVVTGHNVYGIGIGQTSRTAVVAEGVPVNTVLPVISGTTTVGQQLSSTTGTWTSVSTPTYTYQWKRDGVSISSATASTYTLVNADYNTHITCTVTATNTAGPASATSAQTALIAETVPVNTVAPVVSGYVITGLTLSCTTGTWTSITTPTYTYQWNNGGAPIGGATSSTYVAVGGDEGHNITCTVTATNTAGGTPATSNTLSSWIPSNLSMSTWLDANYISSINSGSPTTGDAVGTWKDRSTNALSYTQATTANKPTWNTSIINGRPALLFNNASNQYVEDVSQANIVSRTVARTIVWVAQVTSFSNAFLYIFNAKASASNPSMGYSTNGGFFDIFFGDDTSAPGWKVFRMSPLSGTTNWHYIVIEFDGVDAAAIGSYNAYFDTNTATLTSTAGNNGTNTSKVGSVASSTTHGFNGYVAELMVFTTKLTGSNLTNLQTYLNTKYGL